MTLETISRTAVKYPYASMLLALTDDNEVKVKVRVRFICGCGAENYNWGDWISHFMYNRFWRAIRHFLLTQVRLEIRL